MSERLGGEFAVLRAAGRWSGPLGLAAALVVAVLLIGCTVAPVAPVSPEQREYDDAAEAWASVLQRLRPYEDLDLDRRMELAAQSTSVMEAELDKARALLTLAQSRRRDLLSEIELGVGASTQPDWTERLQAAGANAAEAQRRSVQVERKLIDVRSELAAIRRLIAQRDLLVREAAEHESRLRAAERKLPVRRRVPTTQNAGR